MKRLRTCDGCKRHVFVTEHECPFCHLPLTAAPAPAQVSVPSGASRAQRLALAAALGGQGLLGCAESTAPTPSDPGTAVPVYGAPVAANQSLPTGGRAAPAAGGGSTRPDAGVAVPLYGAPAPTRDAGVITPVYGAPLAGQPAPKPDAGQTDEDAGPADAGPKRDGGPMVHPLYGAPAPAYGLPPTPKN